MTDTQHYYIGLDGGGTRCRARIADTQGNTLGEAVSGSANVFQNAKQAWQSVQSAISDANQQAGLSSSELTQAIIVAGLAGAEVNSCASEFLSLVQGFQHFTLLTDAQIACLGAHNGQDGAIYIVGTGAIGIAFESGHWRRVSGWGFPLDDIGSGAWLGQQAVRAALRAHDGVTPASDMTNQVWDHFNHSSENLLTWSGSANSGDYGQFSPLVTRAYKAGDPVALNIVQQQLDYLSEQMNSLVTNDLSLSLMGGLSDWIAPLLPMQLQNRLTPSQSDALTGALRYAQRGIKP
ncbi:BadF/BadG/BcrA/BcrD ATPase family protein [Reinekea blandensis]|uniref:Putative N-acetylglucosamine kinase n=1 Tax=Reinekea blandensis MED297 TaxID=314283 RepID=A4BJ98_9GAMM|nr:BadF/BadG/BcrA/BcrD ATPase family protein [Reinekea blandensis]EAR07756.1 putative N-acetylglucosamine kinase [Reinekea sp. MED297] [Reinekea blandensis MED297]